MNKKERRAKDDICYEYLNEIARTLGQDRADRSNVYWRGGWFYLNIASRWKDGSVGTAGRSPQCLRKKEVLRRIETIKIRPDFKGTAK